MGLRETERQRDRETEKQGNSETESLAVEGSRRGFLYVELWVYAAALCCFEPPWRSMRVRLNAGMSSGLRLKMNWPSVTTS
jgi:hypothetical protein